MQWVILSVSDLNDARAAPIIRAIQTTVLAAGQADPTTNLIAQVSAEIRGLVGFSGKYQVDANSPISIPPNLKDMAVQRICRMAKSRVNLPWTDSERLDEQTYQSRLNIIRDGRWPIDAPDNPAVTNPDLQGAGRVEFVRGFHRRFKRKDLRAL